MAGINTLQELYRKKGESWTREFLSSDLRITEKAEAYRFSFEMSRNNKLRYFGKNSEYSLNRIDRTVSDLYEAAISQIEKLPEAILINLPKNHRFGFNWIPESGLTLTDITLRSHGKVTKQIHEKPVLERWSSLLHVKWGDELHNGKLEESQVASILESLRSNELPMLTEGHSNKTYVIRGKETIAKIAPPLVKERIQKSHTFDLLLLQIYEHVESLEMERFAFHTARPDEKYIEFVCEAFNRFITEKGAEFLAMGIKKPGFLEKSGKFNRKWIKNTQTLKILENSNFEYLLSIFLTNLRKPKKASGLLSESFVSRFNQKINELDDFVRNSDDYGFPEFNTIIEKESEIKEDDGFSTTDHLKAVGMMQTFFAAPSGSINVDEDEEKVVHECHALLINMGQFTNKVVAECERIQGLTGKSFVLIHDVSAGKHCLWGMSPETGGKAAAHVAKDYPQLFECSESMTNPSLDKICNSFGERQISKVFTGRSAVALQKECESQQALGISTFETEVSQLKGNQDKEISECMDKEDFSNFKKIYPESIQKFWNNMQSEWSEKAYV